MRRIEDIVINQKHQTQNEDRRYAVMRTNEFGVGDEYGTGGLLQKKESMGDAKST